MIRWIWQVPAPGEEDRRGVAATLGRAQEAAEKHLLEPGRHAVVQAVHATTVNGQELYGDPAGRRYVGHRAGNRITWTLTPLPPRPAAGSGTMIGLTPVG